MREKIFDFPQDLAIELGLDIIDLMLFSVIRSKEFSDNTRKIERDGKTFAWVDYKSVLEHLPILNIKKRALGNRFDKMVSLGLIEKYLDTERGKYTYFKTCPLAIGTTKDSHSNADSIVTPMPNKEYLVNKILVSSKEKDITKVISKKKDDKSLGFDNEMAMFLDHVDGDQEFRYSLRSYCITNLGELVLEFKSHIVNNGLVGEFMKNGYQRNKMWLLRAIPKMDITKAVGFTLGKGEYLKDGKRYYIHPKGIEKEVPIDAPPRQLTSQVWYAEEKRWGPQL